MASIPIYRYDYGSSEFAGFPPNKIISGVTAVGLASGSAGNTIGANTSYGSPEFKDHKTLFVIANTSGADKVITFKAGDSYQGVNDLAVTAPSGTTYIWLDSAKFADKETGVITVESSVSTSLSMCGIELR